MASTRPIRASSPRRKAEWIGLLSRKCWKWRRSAPKSCRCARSSSPWCTRYQLSCAPPSTTPDATAAPATLICARRTILVEQSGRDRHRLFPGRSADHAAPARGCPGHSSRHRVHAAGRGQHQRRHDHPGGVGRQQAHGHDLHDVSAADFERACALLDSKTRPKIGYQDARRLERRGQGVGHRQWACARMPACRCQRPSRPCRTNGINIRAITTSEIKVLGADRCRLYGRSRCARCIRSTGSTKPPSGRAFGPNGAMERRPIDRLLGIPRFRNDFPFRAFYVALQHSEPARLGEIRGGR